MRCVHTTSLGVTAIWASRSVSTMLANSSAAIGERAMRSRAFIDDGLRRRPAAGLARAAALAAAAGLAPLSLEALDLLAQALDLLQDLLELVLGAAELRAPGA